MRRQMGKRCKPSRTIRVNRGCTAKAISINPTKLPLKALSQNATAQQSTQQNMRASSSSSMHPASLVDQSIHSPALLELVQVKLSKPIIEYVVDCVADTVDFAMGRTPVRGRQTTRRPELAKFTNFVNTVLTRAEVTTPVVLATLVYIDRARPHLHIALEEWALERVFLGAIIVASKYLNDSTLKNIHWALCTGVFGKRDVGRIEREFLDVLDWELSVSEQDLLVHHADISAIIFAHTQRHTHSSPASSPSASPASSTSSSSPSSLSSSASSSSRHHPYSPYRTRNHHRSSAPVPDLVSSPMSSDGSSSPQTPSTLESSPDSTDDFYHPRRKAAPAASAKPSTSGFHDLLRSFPIPTSTHRSRSHHHTQTQFPIQV
ncbi:hypothetical protein D9758_019117 [Tetrapyrgos nigripes]|uniref:Cyclin N-terminal domain-containing protein n=1 Tax=Tetrapyrgos nigripes TaxID=182062 RepID=A0A8H5AZ30_9AGAR|nr:hypothetical protein D9758_019117 [Tetrapyrgos nigripes]